MPSSLKGVSFDSQPVTEKAAKKQVKNNAGGYVFKIDDLERAKRFLILGSESTFYQSGQKLSKDNADVLRKLSESKHSKELVDLIVAVSTAGRAPKQSPGLFALAIASSFGTTEDKAYALAQLPAVARTASSLFEYIEFAQQFRGWGPAFVRAIGNWYTEKSVDKLAYQVVKYRQRNGFSQSDVVKLAHPRKAHDESFNGLMRWIRSANEENIPRVVEGFLKAQKADLKDIPGIVREYGLSWEMLDTSVLNDAKVWKALLDGNVPLGALLRQLPRLTRIGVIKPLDRDSTALIARLTDKDELSRARLHPMNILIAQRTYAAGSARSGGDFKPDQRVVDALDKAFYLAFKYVEPAGKRTLLALDTSASMTWYPVGGLPLDAREASAALAMVTEATEPETHVVGFTRSSGSGRYNSYVDDVTPLNISSKMRLPDVLSEIGRQNAGMTVLSAPMDYAARENLDVDTFVIFTDNETNAGSHPFQALEKYRKKSGINAKLIVVAMTSTGFSIAKPDDGGMLDIAGMDTAVPALIAEFSKGL